MICISIGKLSMIREVNTIKPSLVEIRYDLLRKKPEEVAGELDNSLLQVATCRPGIDTDEERMQILKEAIGYGAVYVDVELESDTVFTKEIAAFAKKNNVHLIVSYHNFNRTPTYPELKGILEDCYKKGGDVAKIACQVNHESDNARLMALYAEEGRKVVLGMGDKGRITRVAATWMGAEFTFAALSADESTAPGQLTFDEMSTIEKLMKRR